MAIDIYVMPLWRFKAGDFTPPISQVFGDSARIWAGGQFFSPKHWVQRFSARREIREVKQIKAAVSAQNGCTINWRDDGPVLMSEQTGGFIDLRSFALWLHYRDHIPEFTAPRDRDFYKHPVWKTNETRELRFPHLIANDCFSDYFLPCDFQNPSRIESNESSQLACSSIRLLDELKQLQNELLWDIDEWRIRDESEDNEVVEIDGWKHQADQFYYVKWGFDQLMTAAELSCKHRLPIIFWG